jgi:hypothetical protein
MQVTCSLLDINNRKETEFGQIVQLRWSATWGNLSMRFLLSENLIQGELNLLYQNPLHKVTEEMIFPNLAHKQER